MTVDKKVGIIRDPALLQPSAEMISKTVAAFKAAPELWEEFKAIEVSTGNLWNDTGEKITSKIKEINPEINGFQLLHLRMRLRELARKEAGIIDK